MRTTVWQIIRLAWKLYRHPYRKDLRIGQMICNTAFDLNNGQNPFYIENEQLIRKMGVY